MAVYNGPIADVFDVETGDLIYSTIAHKHAILNVVVCNSESPRLPVFATCSHDGTIKLIELQTGKILVKIRSTVPGPCRGVCLCEAATSFILGACGREIWFWDMTRGIKDCILKGHEGIITCLICFRGHPALIDDAHPALIVSGDDKHVIRIWLLEPPFTNTHILLGHTGSILSVKFLPKKNCFRKHDYIFSTSVDKTCRVWDAKTGNCLFILMDHTGPVQITDILTFSGIWDGGKYLTRRTNRFLDAVIDRDIWREDVLITAGLDGKMFFYRLYDCSLLHFIQRPAAIKGISAALIPRPLIIATSAGHGIDILDMTLQEDLHTDFKTLIESHTNPSYER